MKLKGTLFTVYGFFVCVCTVYRLLKLLMILASQR